MQGLNSFEYAALGRFEEVKRSQGGYRSEGIKGVKFWANLGSFSVLRLDKRYSRENQVSFALDWAMKEAKLSGGTHLGFYLTKDDWRNERPSKVVEL